MTAAGQPATFPYIGRIGRYGLRQRIGGNATSTVYSAFDERGQRPVALKTIVADLKDEPEARERFLREARVTRGLVHPNIVRMFEAGEVDGHAYIAMELLEGLPLDEQLKRKPADLDQRVAWMIQLGAGLQAAHARRIVHRDIKPANLFVTFAGVLKILDFGLVRLVVSTLTANGQIIGTPDFMAPEQAEGRGVDARSDVFSAAAVCYWMLSGRAPFTRRDLPATLLALLSEPAPPITECDVPPWLMAIVEKGLDKNPGDRYQSALDMQRDLERVAASGPPSVWQRFTARVIRGRS
jgi:serine/threonine-protein kinase